ncbi:glycosyltransferase [Sphingopyxis chilensis]|uniref:glycosyltransferase n=1 Tax=Sphingopyxis chilensis TaxID=180400 RepID=UPI002DDD4757|nr:glycosyltransferase [Sphingopyxis chilensis]
MKIAPPSSRPKLPATYVLPLAASRSHATRLGGYLSRLSREIDEVIVVDGSPPDIFAAHHRAWSGRVRHMRPVQKTTNGKVGGVMTGVAAASHEPIILADDDVRYRRAELSRVFELLATHDAVRPQNFFWPLPWHARWDTARILINRVAGGDWPGTLGVRRSSLLKVGGYSGDVLFENLEMIRSIEAGGGREAVPLDLFVARRPPDARHFLSQRTRQAYDEWARPERFVAQLSLLPAALLLATAGGPEAVIAAGAASIPIAEFGRRKAGGGRVFLPSSALWTPAWLAERSITSWLALAARTVFGGVRYRATRLKRAATPRGELVRRVAMLDLGCHALPAPPVVPRVSSLQSCASAAARGAGGAAARAEGPAK